MTQRSTNEATVNMSRRGFLACGAAAAALAMAPLPVSAFAANGLAAARRKLDAYNALYGATHKFASAWQRYLQFVDPENGPRGRETRINGLLPPDAAEAELAAAEKLLGAQPAVPEADRAAKALVQFYREAGPKMAEAARFFETYEPKADQGRAGQELHRGMRSLMTFTTDARTDLFKAADAMRGELEPLELAALAAKGKGAHWHVRLASVEARKLREALPVAPGGFDPAVLGQRLEDFRGVVETCKAFDTANPGKLSLFQSAPNLYHMQVTRLQQQIAARPEPAVATRADIAALHTAYAQLVTFSDLFFSNHP